MRFPTQETSPVVHVFAGNVRDKNEKEHEEEGDTIRRQKNIMGTYESFKNMV